MIIDISLNALFGLLNLILTPVGNIQWTFTNDKLQPILEVLDMVFYIIPIRELMPIVFFFIALMGLRIAIAIIKTIWALLPIL